MEVKAKILFVDDEEIILSNVKDFLEDTFDITTENSPQAALELLKNEKFDIVISDFKMPKMSGADFLSAAKKLDGCMYGILLTAYAEKSILQQMINDNLVNKVIEKPYKLRDLRDILEEGVAFCEKKKIEAEKIAAMKLSFETLKNETDEEIIGATTTLKNVYEKVLTVAKHPVNVLITGETGTGKELIAKTIHYLSPRRYGPFIKINSTAIPETLFESELFGYKKGAFSNATQDKAGKIELAHNGTLFLDEVGDMELGLQAKLLRVLQEKEVERLGSNKVMKVDFRLIVAANKNLISKIDEGLFREDLFYRMNEFSISLPPLRERKEDIEAMFQYFMNKSCKELDIPSLELSKEALLCLKQWNWPGNIRELKNAVKRVCVLCADEKIIRPEHFDFLGLRKEHFSGKKTGIEEAIEILKNGILSKELAFSEVEDKIVTCILKHFNNNVAEAVEQTGISKNRFYKIKETK